VQFKLLHVFVMGDSHIVKIHAHGSPCGLAGFFGLLHEDLWVTRKVYQENRKN